MPGSTVTRRRAEHAPVPSGLAPLGLAPLGLAPLGLAPLGLAPLGLAPLGLAPLGLARSGRSSQCRDRSDGSVPTTRDRSRAAAATGCDGPTVSPWDHPVVAGEQRGRYVVSTSDEAGDGFRPGLARMGDRIGGLTGDRLGEPRGAVFDDGPAVRGSVAGGVLAARLAAETRPGWDAGALNAVVEGVQRLDVDGLSLGSIERALGELTTAIRRLQAAQTRLVGVVQSRRATTRRPGDAAGGSDKVERQSARFLTDELRVPPAEARRTARTARRLDQTPRLRALFEAGLLSPEHVAAISGVLTDVPLEQRDAVEAELVTFARTATPYELAREARRQLALADHDAARRRERSGALRRRAGWYRLADGALRVDATLYGLAAETVQVALDAATPPPCSDDQRSHDQRRADGLVALCEQVLRAGTLPARHGVRPHVNVVVSLEDLRGFTGVAAFASGETATLDELTSLFADCAVSRTVLGLQNAPLAGSAVTRTVPAALWRALLVRDGGCTWANCDAPASWCHVAHGEVPFAAKGTLTPDNAALLCPHHHATFDRGGYDIRIDGDAVTYHRNPSRPSAAELARRAAGGPDPGGGLARPPAAELARQAAGGPDPGGGLARPPAAELARQAAGGPDPGGGLARPPAAELARQAAGGPDPGGGLAHPSVTRALQGTASGTDPDAPAPEGGSGRRARAPDTTGTGPPGTPDMIGTGPPGPPGPPGTPGSSALPARVPVDDPSPVAHGSDPDGRLRRTAATTDEHGPVAPTQPSFVGHDTG